MGEKLGHDQTNHVIIGEIIEFEKFCFQIVLRPH